jgi:hypothetical protein
MATINTRYGYSQPVSDADDPWITRELIAELRTEQFDGPHAGRAVAIRIRGVSRTGRQREGLFLT